MLMLLKLEHGLISVVFAQSKPDRENGVAV